MTIQYHGPTGNVNDPSAQAAVAQLAAIRARLQPADGATDTNQATAQPAIYTVGYGAGWSPVQVRDLIHRLDAQLLDIRLKPWSKTEHWQRPALRALLGPAHYLHVLALGNLNYNNDGPIVLQAPAAGVAIVRQQLDIGDVVLLCGCRDVHICHRSVAADLLHEALGAPIIHLEPQR
jgi:hypothetical protein